MSLKRSLRSPLRPAALSPLQRALIAGGVTAPPGTPAFTITLDNLVGLTGGGTTNVFMTGSSGGGGVITAKASASRLIGVAPLYVNFDATATTSTLSTNPSHELFFAHDFGDTGAGTWANGVQSPGLTSKNAGYGPVTGHVYETPGTYTYTMAVTDGVNTATRTKTIVVQDPNVVYAGALTICISHSGNFTGVPDAGSNVLVNTAGNTDMYAALNGIADKNNKRILFCKADAWTCSAQNTFANVTGMTISGYGTGVARSGVFNASASDTLIDVTPAAIGGSVFNLNAGNSDIRIHNFKIAGNVSAKASGLNNSISKILFSKVEVRGALGGFTAAPGGGGANNVFDQHCLYECLADEHYFGGGGFSFYVGLVRGGIMGCYIDQCNAGEGALRVPFIDRGHINNNYIARPNYGKNIVKIHSFVYREMPLRSEKFVFSCNVMDMRGGYSWDGTTVTEVGTPGITIGNGGALGDERVRDCIVENNYTYSGLGNPKTELWLISVGCPNITIRNNIADLALGDRASAFTNPYAYTALAFAAVNTTTNDCTDGVRIYNNTLYSNMVNPENASFVRISGITTPATVSFSVGSPGVFTKASDHQFGTGFKVRLGGTPPTPLAIDTDYWVTSTGLTATQFTLAATDGGAPLELTSSGSCTVTQFEQPRNVSIKNNLWYLPHLNPARSGAAYGLFNSAVLQPNTVTASNNTGNSGSYSTSPGFINTPPVALADWRIGSGSYGVNTGTAVPVFRDFNNASRVGAGNHLGAVLP